MKEKSNLSRLKKILLPGNAPTTGSLIAWRIDRELVYYQVRFFALIMTGDRHAKGQRDGGGIDSAWLGVTSPYMAVVEEGELLRFAGTLVVWQVNRAGRGSLGVARGGFRPRDHFCRGRRRGGWGG